MNNGYVHGIVPIHCFRVALTCLLVALSTSGWAQISANTYSFSTTTTGVLESVTTPDGVLITGNGATTDDVSSAVTNLPFTFNLAGTNYTQFSVNSNGLLRLGTTQVPTTGVNALPGTAFPVLAPYWDDISFGTNGSAVYKTVGTSPNRKFVIDWFLRITKNNANAPNVHIQCWLYESTHVITFLYGAAVVTNSSQYSIGIANSATDYMCITTSSNTAGTASAVNNNTAALVSGRTYTFTPPLPVCATSLSPASASTGISPLTTLTWSPGSSGGFPTGYDVYFGTASTPPLVSTAQSSTTYTPTSALAWNTTYYWQVVPRNGTGTATGCTINSFTTAPTLQYDVSRLTGQTFNSIASTGSSISSWRFGTVTDDNLSNSVPLGFSFNYQGASFSNVLVSTNGFLTFNTSTTADGASSGAYSYLNTAFSASDANKSVAVLAPFWDDLTCQGNSGLASGLSTSIRYLTTGSAPVRIFTVEWIGMETNLIQGADLNFQVKLYEGTNVIEFCYGTMTGFFGNINTGTAPLFSYSLGINALNVSGTTSVREVISQQVHNTRNFKDSTAKAVNNLLTVPECNSLIRFSPGTYTAYVPPSSNIPANDAPANAILVSVNAAPCTNLCGSVFSSAGGTSSGISVQSGLGVADDDVWFKFVATSSSVSVRVLGGTNYDPSVEVFSTLPTNATTRIAYSGTIGTGFSETANVNGLTVGNTYYLRVFHYGVGYVASGTLGGDFSLCVFTPSAAPSNDNCSGAIPLTIGVACTATAGSSLTATASAGLTACSAVAPDPAPNADDDVWFSFVAVNPTETITVQSGHKFNATVQVFSGSCGALTSMSCTNSSKNAQAEVVNMAGLTVGSTYYVRVYQYTVGAGRGSFSICVTSTLPACPTSLYPPSPTSGVSFNGITITWNRVSGATGYDVYLDTLTSAPATTLISSNQPDTFYMTGVLLKGETYRYRIAPRNGLGANEGCFSNVFAVEPYGFNLIVKAFLQGFYKGNGMMRATINPVSLDTLADTLTVKLYSATSPYTLQYQTKALLETDGMAMAEFPQPSLLQSYYIALENRNHLETWSSAPFYFGTPDTTYNFTSSASSAFGSNLVLLETGKFGLYAGDVNQDDAINLSDLLLVATGTEGTPISLYRKEDINGDQVVESADYSFLESGAFLGKLLLRP